MSVLYRIKSCERCLRGEEAKYRVNTDVIDMQVCAACAEEAGELGIAVDVLNLENRETTKPTVSSALGTAC